MAGSEPVARMKTLKQITLSLLQSHSIETRALAWLVRVRYFSIGGQLLAIWVASTGFPGVAYLPGLWGGLVFSCLLTGAALLRLRRVVSGSEENWCGALLVADIIQLTLMLHWSGGAHNPFTSLYLLLIALAAMVLSRAWALGIAALSIAGFVILHENGLEVCGLGPPIGFIPAELHFRGMVVALALTGAFLAWFIGSIQRDLRRREAELQISRDRLAREERFSSLATLAAGVAHELATPLGTIALVSCELERSIGAHCMNPSCLEDARLIRCEVDRCRSIIDRLNVDSDADLGTAPTVIPLKVLPDQLRGILSPEVVARFEAEVSPVAAGQVLEAPRAALMQALCVLIKNGAEADASGRPVRLGISLMEDVRSHAREVLFSVRDQGGGISPEIAERLGEPFLTTKPPGQGMGLGLYIVRLFAERLHGRLEFAAVPGGGTEARLALPLGPKA